MWAKYRYLLPNLVVFSIQLSTAAATTLLLDETHPVHSSRRNPGVALRRWLARLFGNSAVSSHRRMYDALPEDDISAIDSAVIEDDHELEAQTTPIAGPPSPPRGSEEREQVHVELSEETKTAPKIFTSQIILQISSVSFLAYHKVSSDAVMGTFLSLPPAQPTLAISSTTTSRGVLTTETTGGFGLSAHYIGLIFLAEALFRVAIQPTCIPWVIGRLGALGAYWLVLAMYPIAYLFTPFLPGLPRIPGIAILLLDLCLKVALSSVGYVCSAVL